MLNSFPPEYKSSIIYLFVASVKFVNSGMYTLYSVAACTYFLLLTCNIDNQVW